MRYLPHSAAEIKQMLERIGAPTLDALFESIPPALRLKETLKLPPPLDEIALLDHLRALGAEGEGRPFLGAGAAPHHLPPVVSQILSRGELLTAYTPYQPECAQGTLQLLFEFQTLCCALTGMEVANASMYDGAHAMAEAALLALRVARGKRKRLLVAKSLHPLYRRVLHTYLQHSEVSVELLPWDASGAIDQAALKAALGPDGESVAAVLTGYPNFFGVVEALDEISSLAKEHGALSIAVTTEAVAFGLLSAPGALGADLAVGELGSFGNAISFGGPSVGFFAAKERYLRQLPGRLCGATTDRQGKRGFVLTLSAREQHIRREKAASNICTNQGLCATAATLHLELLGRHGLRTLANINWQRTRYARERLQAAGATLLFDGPVFNEFALQVKDAAAVKQAMQAAGLQGGLRLSRYYDDPQFAQALLFAVTELHTPAQIDALAQTVATAGGVSL